MEDRRSPPLDPLAFTGTSTPALFLGYFKVRRETLCPLLRPQQDAERPSDTSQQTPGAVRMSGVDRTRGWSH